MRGQRMAGQRWVAATALLILVLAPGRATSAAGATGNADTTSEIVRLTAGSSSVAVGADTTQTTLGASRSALARFIAGDTAVQRVGQVERTGTEDAHSGENSTSPGAVEVDGLVSLDVVDASAEIAIASSDVLSRTAAQLADVSLLNGLVTFEGLASTSTAVVDEQHANASRSVTLDGLTLFDVGSVLDALGVDPLALACTAIETAGSTLAVDTADACEQLEAIEDSIASAGSVLDSAASSLSSSVSGFNEGDTQTARDTVAALSCELTDLVCVTEALATITSVAAEYGIVLDDPTDLTAAQQQLLDGLDALLAAFHDIEVVATGIADTAAGTCAAVADAIDTTVAGISTLDPAGLGSSLPPVGDALDAACASLRGTLDVLLDTPLVRLDDVQITVEADARPDAPTAQVSVNVGSITVGLSTPVALPLTAEGDVAAEVEALRTQLAAAVDALGIGMPDPQLELFVIDTAHGPLGGDEWFAQATMTTVRLTLPSATLILPDSNPLAVLSTTSGGVSAPIRPSGAIEAPSLVAESGVFDAEARYTAGSASCTTDCEAADENEEQDEEQEEQDEREDKVLASTNGQIDGDSLPRTGLGSRAAAIGGWLMLLGAAILRRRLLAG